VNLLLVPKLKVNYYMIVCLFLIVPFVTRSQVIPSSDRSREVVTRVKPNLAKRLNEKGLQWGSAVFLRIFKEEYQLEVWVKKGTGYVLFTTYDICTWGFGGTGPKECRGDGQAPEGFYFVTPARLNPYSKFHLGFDIGYPNAYDRYHNRTGSALMVHGECSSSGCYAITNPGIEEIWCLADAAFRNGISSFRVHIFPFRMTPVNMEKHQSSRWFSFWENLKEGYDIFEQNGYPPDILVKNGRYAFIKD
jgi:murein L,D-transpeptidase YafK